MLIDQLIGLIILMFSAIFHEVAHGFVADRLGDPTARIAGRLTLNPKSHIDIFGTILLPLLMIMFSNTGAVFGWAKPVPVDQFNLRDGRKDMALVALAGPFTNIILAVIMSLLIHLLFFLNLPSTILLQYLKLTAEFNLSLAIFNLFPIPPLDGSKVFSLLLPEKEANRYLSLGQFGFLILIVLLYLPFSAFSIQHVIISFISLSMQVLGLSSL